MGACCSCYEPPEATSRAVSSVELAAAAAGRRNAQREDDARAMLRRLHHESLAWVQLIHHDSDPRKGSRPYYWSAITGESVWTKPANFYSVAEGPRLPARIADLPDCVAICDKYHIRFHLAEPNLDDPVYGRLIGGSPPDLAHCLFYQPFLVRELGVYPLDFIRKMGLKQITLMDGLSYGGQARRAITVAGTGTLYLDPGPLAIYYLQDVFHHELFHLMDYPMLAEREIALVAPGHALSPLQPLAAGNGNIEMATTPTPSSTNNGISNGIGNSNGVVSSAQVWRSTDWEARQRRGLLSVGGSDGSGSDSGSEMSPSHYEHKLMTLAPSSSSSSPPSTNGITTRASSHSDADPIDHRWLLFNPPGFVYGNGGAKTRGAGAFLSSGTVAESVVSGFLNRYSMSAPEEDKAEIYAGLFRHAPALLLSDDPVIALKALEMKERLEGFCPSLNDAFWVTVLNHTPSHVKRAREGSWAQKHDPHGHIYWYNSVTLQVSWLKPTLFDSPPPRPLPTPIPAGSPTSVSPTSSTSTTMTLMASIQSQAAVTPMNDVVLTVASTQTTVLSSSSGQLSMPLSSTPPSASTPTRTLQSVALDINTTSMESASGDPITVTVRR